MVAASVKAVLSTPKSNICLKPLFLSPEDLISHLTSLPAEATPVKQEINQSVGARFSGFATCNRSMRRYVYLFSPEYYQTAAGSLIYTVIFHPHQRFQTLLDSGCSQCFGLRK